MKKVVPILSVLLVLAVLLCACSQELTLTTTPTSEPATTPTTKSTTEPTTAPTIAPTTKPTTEPTSEPTEPQYTDLSWLPAQVQEMTYGEFFSETRIFSNRITPLVNRWKLAADGSVYSGNADDEPNRGYALCLDNDGFFVVSFFGENFPLWFSGTRTEGGFQWDFRREPLEIIWEVPGDITEDDIDCYITDGRYAYCVRNQNELFRLDLVTGMTETLATAERFPMEVALNDWIVLYDNCVLLFVSQNGDTVAINRLYLPTLTHDVLYDGIPADAFYGSFIMSCKNSDLLFWQVMDTNFLPRLLEVVGDADSEYRDYLVNPGSIWGSEDIKVIASHNNYISLVQAIERQEGISSLLYCYYDIPNGTYTQERIYWDPNMSGS